MDASDSWTFEISKNKKLHAGSSEFSWINAARNAKVYDIDRQANFHSVTANTITIDPSSYRMHDKVEYNRYRSIQVRNDRSRKIARDQQSAERKLLHIFNSTHDAPTADFYREYIAAKSKQIEKTSTQQDSGILWQPFKSQVGSTEIIKRHGYQKSAQRRVKLS